MIKKTSTPQDYEQKVATLQRQVDWLLEQYKKVNEENEKLREKVRTFYGT